MKVFIFGIDGYIGWPLALELQERGHEVVGLDNGSRRRLVHNNGSDSAIPIKSMFERSHDHDIPIFDVETTYYAALKRYLEEVQPDCIVYLAEQPSAPYSMKDFHSALVTQHRNVIGTLATLFALKDTGLIESCHLLKLGTMGEYGTPNTLIPEGVFPEGSEWYLPGNDRNEDEYYDLSGMMFPRKAGSWYHLSKVHDTYNVEFACRNWGLRASDVMQGVVYGTQTPALKEAEETTRFDFDEMFGTVINRFCAQAVAGLNITPYGLGEQRRGFLPLKDSVSCLALSVENPPAESGIYRPYNQFCESWSMNQLADAVAREALELGLTPHITNIPNVRNEAEEHRYDVTTDKLRQMGYAPSSCLAQEVKEMMQDLLPHRDTILEFKDSITPKTKWG